MARLASPDRDGPAPAAPCLRVVLLVADARLDVAVPAHLPVVEVVPELCLLAERVGAAPGTGQVCLARAGHQALDPATSLHEQGVGDGEILVLQPADDPAPFVLAHELVGAVQQLVDRDARTVDAPLLRRAHGAGLAVAGGSLLLLVPLAGPAGPWVGAAAVVASWFLVRHADDRGDALLAGVAGALFTLHLGLLGHLVQAVTVPAEPSGPGFLAGLSLAGLGLLWAPAGLREWALAPGIVAASLATCLALSRLLEQTAAALTPHELVGVVALLLLLAAGPLRAAVVGVTLVRREETTAALGGPRLGRRVAAAGRLLLALDVAIAVLLLVAVPVWASRNAWGLVTWLGVMAVLVLRTRGEGLAVRAVLGWVTAAAVTLWGLVHGVWFHGWAAGPPSGAVVTAAIALAGAAGVLCAAGALGHRTSVWGSRAASVGEKALRVALPSAWLLHSGVLPGWGS